MLGRLGREGWRSVVGDEKVDRRVLAVMELEWEERSAVSIRIGSVEADV